jgi:hypothetical protein
MVAMRWSTVFTILVVALIIVAGGLALNRVDRTLDCLAQANAELVKANAQLRIANRHIEEMHARLADTSRKLDETNANLALTNNKIVAIDQVFQRFTGGRRQGSN